MQEGNGLNRRISTINCEKSEKVSGFERDKKSERWKRELN